MVVLFRGESLIWFWGRHFFVQGIGGEGGGGCCCSLSEWNSCCYAVQFPPPPEWMQHFAQLCWIRQMIHPWHWLCCLMTRKLHENKSMQNGCASSRGASESQQKMMVQLLWSLIGWVFGCDFSNRCIWIRHLGLWKAKLWHSRFISWVIKKCARQLCRAERTSPDLFYSVNALFTANK